MVYDVTDAPTIRIDRKDQEMSALGHQQSFRGIIGQCLLLGGKRTFDLGKLAGSAGPAPERLLFPNADVRGAGNRQI